MTPRTEKFIAAFVGTLVLLGICSGISIGFAWLLVNFGPIMFLPVFILCALFAGVMHASDDKNEARRHD